VWIPAKLQISDKYIRINWYWDRIEVRTLIDRLQSNYGADLNLTHIRLEMSVSANRRRVELYVYSNHPSKASIQGCE
jgi:hypothetical protein